MSGSNDVAESWLRIETWLDKKAKRVRKKLAKGASDEMIVAAERELGVSLPEDVRASYRVHDGAEESDLFPASGTDETGYSPLSLEAALTERREDDPAMDQYVTADAGVRAKYWHPRWVPIAGNGGGDQLCVDLAPAVGGTAGQVIEWLHETSERKLLTPSLAAYLKDLADGLEGGTFKYDGESGVHRPTPRQTPADRLAEMQRNVGDADLNRISPDRPYQPDTPPGRRVVGLCDRIDPERRFFGLPCDDYKRVTDRLIPIGNTSLFYDHFAPRRRVSVNGYVLFTIPEILEATAPHYVKHREAVLFGLTPASERLAFDAPNYSHDDGLVPIVAFPNDLNLAKAAIKKRKEAGRHLAKNIVEFFDKVVLKDGPAKIEFV